jgi:hypothetical protein
MRPYGNLYVSKFSLNGISNCHALKLIDGILYKSGLTQNYEKTNRKERKEREGKRVSESSCVSPISFTNFG